jgi:ABC O-antigen/lipopolysaccharide exporter, ATPase subunit
MSSDLMLKLENVSKIYHLYSSRTNSFLNLFFPYGRKCKRFTALSPLSLDIYRGECIGIMGVNGSGKSTLLQMVAGTLTPSTGKIYANGKIMSLLELGSWIDADATGRENIYNAGYIQGLSKVQIREKLPEIVNFAEIGEFIDQPVSTYSSGMVMRLAFAASIYLNSEILLLDEIFAVGDAHFARKCIALLRSKIATSTVLIVSHDYNVITSLCNRAILLDHGEMVFSGSPRDVTERYLERCYGEKQAVTVTPQSSVSQSDGDVRPFSQKPDITFSSFQSNNRSFGEGMAEICDFALLDENGNRITAVKGGECITLKISAVALKPLQHPAIGFAVRSPSGVILFGDVAEDHCEAIPLKAGGRFSAVFRFIMPLFPDGDYSVSASVSTGPLNDHKIQIWHHTAVNFAVTGGIPIQGVLFGLPMKEIMFYHE